MNKIGKGNWPMWTFGIASVLAIIVMIVWLFNSFVTGPATQPTTLGPSGQIIATDISSNCPDNKEWLGTVSVQNALNTTGVGGETYDTTATFYLLNADGTKASPERTVTDTTAGAMAAGSGLTCGSRYRMEIRSTSGNSGDSGIITDNDLSSKFNPKIIDGGLEFDAIGKGTSFTVKSFQHSNPQTKVWDYITSAWISNNTLVQNLTTSYTSGDGQIYGRGHTVAGVGTDFTIGDRGQFDVGLFLQALQADENVNDLGIYFLVDARTATWDTDSANAYWKGSQLSESTGMITPDEKIAYNAYELIYKIDSSKLIDSSSNSNEFRLTLTALAGQNPDADDNVSMDIAPIGRYQSIDGANLHKIG